MGADPGGKAADYTNDANGDLDALAYAGNTYGRSYEDGFLATRAEAGRTTTYIYTARGELTRVALPDGRIIEYVYDPQGRRIAVFPFFLGD